MRPTLLVLSGLPGAGKSTYARELALGDESYVVVNRDALRNMRGKYWIPEQEEMITFWERTCVEIALRQGYNVIVDATNFLPNNIKYWKTLASEEDANYESYFLDTPLEECIERDKKRTVGKCGEEVIRGMYNKYLRMK